MVSFDDADIPEEARASWFVGAGSFAYHHLLHEGPKPWKLDAISDRARAFIALHKAGITSPIEQALAGHLVWINNQHEPSCWFPNCTDVPRGPREFFLRAQAPIGRYRADFLFTLRSERGEARIVVECDGKDYHDRTTAQVTRDKARDRAMVLEEVTVLRFGGSEIWRGAADCAAQVFEAVVSAADRVFGR